MQRREFIKSAIAVGGVSLLGSGRSFGYSYAPKPEPEVKRVLAMFKCHFDAGFIATQAAVVDWYFSDYFPQAIRTADDMRRTGGHKYVWTTGSWLVYEYLEQAAPQDRRRMEQAIAAGDIAWHAIPFSWQTEMMDRSMVAGSIALSKSLDRRFGQTTTGAKMTDVPGHTRGLVSPLAEQGVTFLDIGCNGATVVAEVPTFFVWRDRSGAELMVMYHNSYGATTRVPGTDLAIAINMRGDNSGPHTPDEIVSIYSELSHRFPNAEIVATSLTGIAHALEPYRKQLPVVTGEIGDSWIFGVSSDPMKTARYREVARLRQQWIANGRFQIGDATDVALLRHLSLEAEHTWGADTKTWLDFEHYTPQALAEKLNAKNYQVMEFSWREKRQDLFDGVAALPAPLRSEAEQAIRELEPKEPEFGKGHQFTAGNEIDTPHFVLQLDPKTGAIHRLSSKKSGREWASADHPLALFSYQTLSLQDYAHYFQHYLNTKADWTQYDFGKPNIERYGAKSEEWTATLVEMHASEDAHGHRVLTRLEIQDPAAVQSGRVAFPERLYMELRLPKEEPVVEMSFSWFRKPAMRLPEAMWLTFNPPVRNPQGWMLEKTGEQISPFEVIAGGSRHMHAVTTGFHYKDGMETFAVETVDAPLIALGEKSPLNFSKTQPDLSGGIHSNLYNNAWGSNYIMWYGEDARFRFRLRA